MKRFNCRKAAVGLVRELMSGLAVLNKSQQGRAIDLFTKTLRAAHTAGRRAERSKKERL